MLRICGRWKTKLAVAPAALSGAWVGLAQQPRQVDDKEIWRSDPAVDQSQMGPPISFAIDGKQYIAVTAGYPAGGRGAAGGAPARPANLFVLGLDGKTPLPGAQAPR